jgi:hypothetical protein
VHHESCTQDQVHLFRVVAAKLDRYHFVIAAIDSGAFSHSPEDGLEFGLECILNGIESLVRRRRN